MDIIVKIHDMSAGEVEELLSRSVLRDIGRDFIQSEFEAGRITADEILSVYEGDQ
jgi:hypothetical protein